MDLDLVLVVVERVGPNDQKSGRTILGSVSLPIPGGIKDENGADWQGQTMNQIEIEAAGVARGALGAFEGEMGEAARGTAGRLWAIITKIVNTAIGEVLSGKAVGVQGLMTRTTGMVFNPNLELLFDKPTLRGFTLLLILFPEVKTKQKNCKDYQIL